MDVLSDILGTLALRGMLYFTTEFAPPWGVKVPPLGTVARFHLVMRGTCWIEVEGDPERLRLETGDLVLIPHGAGHILADSPGTPALQVDEVIARSGFTGRGTLVYGGEDRGYPTRLLCGHFEFDEGVCHPFLRQMPARIVIRHEEVARSVLLEEVFRSIVREVRGARPGCDAVVQRLSEVLFIQSVRVWAESTAQDPGILSALANPDLGRCLGAIHGNPAANWTLEKLAREAGLSRTVFAARFKRLMAISPMQYVALWRIQKARRLLKDTQLTIDAIAERVGYGSTAALSRVFKKHVGESPGRHRRGLSR